MLVAADSFITTVKSSTVATNAKANNLGSKINSINKKIIQLMLGHCKPVPESGLSSVQRPVVAPRILILVIYQERIIVTILDLPMRRDLKSFLLLS